MPGGGKKLLSEKKETCEIPGERGLIKLDFSFCSSFLSEGGVALSLWGGRGDVKGIIVKQDPMVGS